MSALKAWWHGLTHLGHRVVTACPPAGTVYFCDSCRWQAGRPDIVDICRDALENNIDAYLRGEL